MKGVIACGDPQTAQAGVEMFSRGGNAVDAAVAATFTSFVAEAVLVNIGGGGIATVFDSRSGTATTYDFFSTMPSGSMSARADFRKIMVDFGPEQQPFYIGRASVSVPGVVAGLGALAAEHGKLSLAQILAPAIRIARRGAVLSDALAYILEILAPIFSDTPRLAARFMHAGRVYQAGERLRFPELAETLAELGRVGPGLFYTGAVAQAIVADQQAHGGLLTAADLAGYRVHKRAPIRVGYRGHEVLLPPPSSSGGVLIAFALKLLESIDLSGTAPGSFEHIRTLAEVMRLTNVARKTWDGKLAPTINFKGYTQPKRALTTRDYDDRIAQFLSATHIDTYRHRLRAILNGAAPPGHPTSHPAPPAPPTSA